MANRNKKNQDFKDNRTKFKDDKVDEKRYKQSKHKNTHKRDFLETDEFKTGTQNERG